MLALVLLSLALVTVSPHPALAFDSDVAVSKGLGDTGIDIPGLQSSLEQLDVHLRNLQKRTCSIAIHSHSCDAEELDKAMKWHQYLKGPNSPGKKSVDMRSDGSDDSPAESPLSRAKSQLHLTALTIALEIDRYRKAVETLTNLANSLKVQKKRSSPCRFNLGAHCLTDEMDRAAEWYYYLHSGMSPGRRRRNAQTANQDQAR